MKTKKIRKKYSKEFKLDVVQQSYQRDNLSELDRELDLQPKSIYRWREAYQAKPDHAFPSKGKCTPLSELGECERLKAENAELRMERDIVQKFYFSCMNHHIFVSHMKAIIVLFFLFSITLSGCRDDGSEPSLFELLLPAQTGIDFVNVVEEKVGNNILESEFFYNGAGVAVGDINNNGLPDIYFTANQGENALYLNHGDFRFENITEQAGVSDLSGWSAGTAMVDINGNGLLDIYVCKAGQVETDERRNKLFINNGDLTFNERAVEFGLDDPGYCTQPVFFDYNRNGLVDVFIVNYNTRHFVGFDTRTIRDDHDPYAGDKLYKNNGDGTFSDVSEEAGILQNPIGFGLSATVSDLTGNGWPDIYVANDFIERDYFYVNQGDGTYSEEGLLRTDVISYFSMGSDIADINNNGLPDILVADMLPPDYSRRKVFKTPNYQLYDHLIAEGYHRKNMRNVLQLNNGDGTFSEVGQLAGISMSDWSWATLIADFDNDGKKDIYITNGFARFYTHMDYLNDILWAKYPDEDLPDDSEILYELVQQMEKVELHNFAFQNTGNLSFTESTEHWGLKAYAISAGTAYADLNGDGSLDLIVNNMNEPPFIYKNRSREMNANNYLKIDLEGSGANTRAIGAKVTLRTKDGSLFFQEAYQTRGFQSTVDPILLFGLGNHEQVDVEVIWPDQSRKTVHDVSVNQTLTLQKDVSDSEESSSGSLPDEVKVREKMFLPLDVQMLGLYFVHQGSLVNDWIFNPLMPHTLTNLGPAVAVEDVNNDGLPDIFVGGGQDQPGALFLQQPNGTFAKVDEPIFDEHSEHDDVDAVFFDANRNGHPDLYIVSGGNFDRMNGPVYQDRLYLNDGFGNFTHAPDAIPQMHTSGGSVTPLDIEGNGEVDLFVGGRVVTGQYPSSPRSYLLENNGGIFTDITEQATPELERPGMVTDAIWADIDNSGDNELIIAGEWMPIRIFKTNGDRTYTEISQKAGLEQTSGWWNSLKVTDLNGDGNLDLIAGNRGLNSNLKATTEEPVILYNGDYNDNGLNDPIITQVINGYRYPVPDRDLLLQQLPIFESKFPDYESYSTATIKDILSEQQLQDAKQFQVHTFASTLFKNNGDGTFKSKPMPRQAQIAPIFDMVIADFYENGLPDILAVGNNFGNRHEFGPIAGQGLMLRADGEFDFTPVASHESGIYGLGDVRSLALVPARIGYLMVVGRYSDTLDVYVYRFPDEAHD